MKFENLRLHSQLIIIVISIWIVLLIVIMSASNYFVGHLNKKMQDDLYIEVKQNMSNIVLSSSHRLGNLATSHSYWTDLLLATHRKDSQWIDKNATKYLLDDPSYKIDSLYLFNSTNGYKEHIGIIPESIYLSLRTQVTPDQLTNSATSFLVNTKNNLYIISISGLTTTDKKNISGYYAIAQNISGDISELLTQSYQTKADIKLTYTPATSPRYIKVLSDTLNDVLSQQLTLDISNILLTKTISSYSNNLLMVVLGSSVISAIILLFLLLKLSSNFEESIERIKQITFHDYSQKIDLNFSKDFSELSHCINNLSSELSKRDRDINCRYFEIISILIKTLEEVDVYTKGHSERVSHYSVELAKAVGGLDLEAIRLSGLLHDVGKITVDTKILNKPDKLNEAEFNEIKKHPLTAYNILDVSDVFMPIKEIVKGHHEKYDGSGYPEGLIGEAIPIGARIVSITDVFDSLTSKRSYRDSMTLDEALEIIREGSGTHFDAVLVDLFIPMANEVYLSWSNLNISPDPEELMPR